MVFLRRSQYIEMRPYTAEEFVSMAELKERVKRGREMKEWERKKLTTAKVLAAIRKYITSQNVVPRKEAALVKTSYGFK